MYETTTELRLSVTLSHCLYVSLALCMCVCVCVYNGKQRRKNAENLIFNSIEKNARVKSIKFLKIPQIRTELCANFTFHKNPVSWRTVKSECDRYTYREREREREI